LEILAFIAAIVAAFANWSLWRDQSNQFTIDQRAWISPNNFGPASDSSANQPIAVKVELTNSGKTPGFVDRVDFSISSSIPPFTNKNWFFSHTLPAGVIPPNSALPLIMVEPAPIGDVAFKQLETGQLKHTFKVLVRYHDIFGNQRKTTFHFGFSGPIEDEKRLFFPEDPTTME